LASSSFTVTDQFANLGCVAACGVGFTQSSGETLLAQTCRFDQDTNIFFSLELLLQTQDNLCPFSGPGR
jgi:hypothetical protein